VEGRRDGRRTAQRVGRRTGTRTLSEVTGHRQRSRIPPERAAVQAADLKASALRLRLPTARAHTPTPTADAGQTTAGSSAADPEAFDFPDCPMRDEDDSVVRLDEASRSRRAGVEHQRPAGRRCEPASAPGHCPRCGWSAAKRLVPRIRRLGRRPSFRELDAASSLPGPASPEAHLVGNAWQRSRADRQGEPDGLEHSPVAIPVEAALCRRDHVDRQAVWRIPNELQRPCSTGRAARHADPTRSLLQTQRWP